MKVAKKADHLEQLWVVRKAVLKVALWERWSAARWAVAKAEMLAGWWDGQKAAMTVENSAVQLEHTLAD